MNCPPIGNEEGLVGYWNFEEGPEESQVLDLSSNGNNGTINGATYSEDVPNQNCSNNSSIIEIEDFSYEGSLNGSDYYLSEGSVIWTEANEICNSLGGSLVAITSQEENDFVQMIISSLKFLIPS